MSLIGKLTKSFRASPGNARGCLDDVENGAAKGWAFDPDHPSMHLNIELRLDGAVFETVSAGEYREDLQRAGMGDGSHSFRCPLPRTAFDGKSHVVEAAIVGAKGGASVVLQNSPITKSFAAPPAQKNAPGNSNASQPLPPGTTIAPDSALGGLSVVIPTHNRAAAVEATLRACLAAAADQAVEFIVIDQGSTDETPARLSALAAEFPNFRSSVAPHAGAGQARNTGVTMAKYELVLFLGDDVQPANGDFFRHHVNGHRMLPAVRVAVLGKITWPNSAQERVSFLMAHVQGAGQQQFGFYNLLPYTWLDWRFFYSANVSFKKSVLADWIANGYSAAFENAPAQDAELAFRMDAALTGGLQILYSPAAAATRHQQFSVRDFIERQMAAGRSGHALTRKHPGAASPLGIDRIDALLASPATLKGGCDDLLRMIEGAKSWGVVVEGRYNLGSQNWHADLLSAIFELSYLQGYILSSEGANGNFAAAYQYALERFQEKMSSAASFEVFGRFPGFTLT